MNRHSPSEDLVACLYAYADDFYREGRQSAAIACYDCADQIMSGFHKADKKQLRFYKWRAESIIRLIEKDG